MSTGEHTKHITKRSQTYDNCQLSSHYLKADTGAFEHHFRDPLLISVTDSRRVWDEFYKAKQGQEQCASRQTDLCTPEPGDYPRNIL